ncbi:multicopper oxidase domain-containing protein [Streptomyces sp. SP18ES09]|uniref:multicopper oxidase family protein n=1 Tax=Streptomyces sp. SP18ES09 TaxID=3002532 RepID=UPI002E7797DF|nr:multicopper oxidase domain-containing protein [Streptomyces sp. SP18ES09]MEE1816200.1 multicopper oxidase domain-containing protein [Streptomyces sp. SP18ES09]
MISRRSVLGGALAAAGLPLLAPGSPAGGEAHAVAGLPPAGPRRAPDPVPAAFTTAMPVPRVLRPLASTGDVDCYELTIRKTTTEILPGFSTDVLTYDGHFPGPVIHARSGRRVLVRHHNGLQMPVAVHLHGGMVPPASDGNPMDVFAPGTSRTYTYTNRQPHASLWFHDHAHHMESEHVYRGLSGTYLLTDDLEQSLPLPKGQYDVPITLRDARFDEKGRLAYTMADRNRTTLLANGRPTPYFQVAARKYRFRLLNGANLRILALALSDGTPLTQIASDGGLLERPASVPVLTLSPGERADVVVDFSRYPVGTRLVLTNSGPGGKPEQVGKVLRFDVVRTAEDPSSVPRVLRHLPPASALAAPAVTRRIELSMDEDGRPDPRGFVNGRLYDPDRVDTTVAFGSSEIWNVVNTNKRVAHNFHMHLVQFRVLERGGVPAGPTEAGLKDTVRVMPGETVKLHVTFDGFRGDYVYHCHMLDHSAMGMMATFRVR